VTFLAVLDGPLKRRNVGLPFCFGNFGKSPTIENEEPHFNYVHWVNGSERENMDHHEQHHLHHKMEREHEKKQHKQFEQEEGKKWKYTMIHPAWFLAVGIVLIGLVVLAWTLAYEWVW
jgi:hypothetical protein